jgi:hypothetical protein
VSTATAGEALWTRPLTNSAPDGLGGEPTLDDVLAGAWEGLTVHAVVDCPMCSGPMAPEYRTRSLPLGGRCGDCGTELS